MNRLLALFLVGCGSAHFAESPGLSSVTCADAVTSTLALSGSDIQDAGIWNGNETQSSGGSTYFNLGRGQRHVVRLAPDIIPDGIITAMRLSFVATLSLHPTVSEFYMLTDGNNWFEGDADYAPEVGAVCWNGARWSTLDWMGSHGGDTAGTDYDEDSDPPTLTVNDVGAYVVDLKPEWARLWRDRERANNGFIWINLPVPGEDARDTVIGSSESPSFPLTLEIDYIAPGQCREE
jgi:hypothetical protein